MHAPPPALRPSPTARLARRVDLLLWRLFGQGARLDALPSTGRAAGRLATLLTALGLTLPR